MPHAHARWFLPKRLPGSCSTCPCLSAHAPPCSFRLLNVRADYQFALVTNRTGTPAVLVASPVLVNAAPNEPTQLHLVPGTDPSE